ITCWITVQTPFIANYDIMAAAKVHCDHPVPSLTLEEDLIANNQYVIDTSYKPVTGSDVNTVVESLICMGGNWLNHAIATVTFPAGYTRTFGSMYGTAELNINVSACPPPPPPSGGGSGGGGGGGCAVRAPSSPARPAVRHPHIIACP